MRQTMRPRVMIASPFSGAVSGIEYVSRSLLRSPLATRWELIPVDTATSRANSERGRASWGGLWSLGRAAHRLHAEIQRHRPQAVWLQCARNRMGFVKFSALAGICFAHSVPVVAKFGGDHFDRFFATLSGPFRDGVRAVLLRCRVILVEARCLESQFAGIIPGDRLRFCYPGIDPNDMPFTARKRQARNLLFCGVVSRAKGAVDLLAAVPSVAKAVPGVRLAMLGEVLRRERSVLHVHDPHGAWKAVKAKPLSVEMAGVLTGPAKRHAFSEADCFVLPSASEGFPIVILEAMASGLPIVCTPVGALPEVLIEGINCRFVPFGNPERLAEVLSDLLSNAGRYARQRMAAENRRLVEERFTLEEFARGVRSALEDVIG